MAKNPKGGFLRVLVAVEPPIVELGVFWSPAERCDRAVTCVEHIMGDILTAIAQMGQNHSPDGTKVDTGFCLAAMQGPA